MRLGLWLVLALAIGALAAHFLLQDNGYVLLRFGGYVAETSVPVLIGVLVAAYAAVRLLIRIWNAPRRLGEVWATARIRHAGRQATRGYIALAEGKLARGERLLTRGARRSETPLLNYLAAARAAQMQGDRERRDSWLRMASEQEPAAGDAVLLTQAELQLDDGDYAGALESLGQIRERQPNHPQALRLLGDLYHRQSDWSALVSLLPLIRRRGNLSVTTLDRWTQDAYGAILAAPSPDRAVLDQRWEEVPRALRREPALQLARAQGLVACGAMEVAEAEIRRTLKERWDDRLVDLYGRLQVGDSAAHLKRLEGWLRERPKDPVLLLAAGRAALRHQLWGKARSYLEASIGVSPSAPAYQELGQLMLRIGESSAAMKAFESGLSLSRAPREAALPRLTEPSAPA